MQCACGQIETLPLFFVTAYWIPAFAWMTVEMGKGVPHPKGHSRIYSGDPLAIPLVEEKDSECRELNIRPIQIRHFCRADKPMDRANKSGDDISDLDKHREPSTTAVMPRKGGGRPRLISGTLSQSWIARGNI